jgi:hypothetical protein
LFNLVLATAHYYNCATIAALSLMLTRRIFMDRKPLRSGKLKAAGFDETLRVLEIEFMNGDVFEYKSVSPEVFRQLMNAPSPSSFFEDKIEESFSGKRLGKAQKSSSGDALDALFGDGA